MGGSHAHAGFQQLRGSCQEPAANADGCALQQLPQGLHGLQREAKRAGHWSATTMWSDVQMKAESYNFLWHDPLSWLRMMLVVLNCACQLAACINRMQGRS